MNDFFAHLIGSRLVSFSTVQSPCIPTQMFSLIIRLKLGMAPNQVQSVHSPEKRSNQRKVTTPVWVYSRCGRALKINLLKISLKFLVLVKTYLL